MAQLEVKLGFMCKPIAHQCEINFDRVVDICKETMEDYKRHLTGSIRIAQIIQYMGDIVGLAEDGRVYQYEKENHQWVQI